MNRIRNVIICLLFIGLIYCLLPISNVHAIDIENNTSIARAFITALPLSAIVTGISVFAVIAKHNKANKSISAAAYVGENAYDVHNKNKKYLRSYETVQVGFYKSDDVSKSVSDNLKSNRH